MASYAFPPCLGVQLPLLIDTLIIRMVHWLEVEHFKLFALGWLEQMQRLARLIRRETTYLKAIDNSSAGAVVDGLRDSLIATSRIALEILEDAENFLAIGLAERTICASCLWDALGLHEAARRLRLDRAERNGSE
jgi:hypothetical protein